MQMATQGQIDKAWENAKKIRGKDPDKYRQDPYGNTMYKGSYGKNSAMGWHVDHITPESKGGSDETRNLQALNVSVNLSKGNSLHKKSRHSKGNK
jgi:5-methylcytosine-specific restriction endonuclease McrA